MRIYFCDILPNFPFEQSLFFFSQTARFELWTHLFLRVPTLACLLTSRWNNEDQSLAALSFMACEESLLPLLYYYLALLFPLHTHTHTHTHMHTHTCPGDISWRHAVWKRVKHWGPAPTVPSCLYELVTHSATNARRSQSQAPQHLCTSEYISVSLRVLELSREIALRTLTTVRQPVGALCGLTSRTEQHVLLLTCPDCCHM